MSLEWSFVVGHIKLTKVNLLFESEFWSVIYRYVYHTAPDCTDPPCLHLPCLQDARLTQWAHETLIQVLNIDLLPVYLDVLQVLKAKVCSVTAINITTSKRVEC